DRNVTGVQTCALPIYESLRRLADAHRAPCTAGPREPAARARPRAPHLELSSARLVPTPTVPAAAAARVRTMAHGHRLRGRNGGEIGRASCRERVEQWG